MFLYTTEITGKAQQETPAVHASHLHAVPVLGNGKLLLAERTSFCIHALYSKRAPRAQSVAGTKGVVQRKDVMHQDCVSTRACTLVAEGKQ